MNVNIYRFRAECETDVEKLKRLLPGHYVINRETLPIEGKEVQLPDVTVVLTTIKSIQEVLEKMCYVPEGHVMRETVQPFTKYTGIRLNNGRHL